MAVLDTSFLIALEQGDEAAVAWLRAHRTEEHVVPDFVAVEYLTGHTAEEEALARLDEAFRIAHGDMDWVRASVRLRKSLRTRKARFRTPDFWIAAWGQYLGTVVVTRNVKHFEAFGVPSEAW